MLCTRCSLSCEPPVTRSLSIVRTPCTFRPVAASWRSCTWITISISSYDTGHGTDLLALGADDCTPVLLKETLMVNWTEVDEKLTNPAFFAGPHFHELFTLLRREDPVHWTTGN